MKIDLKNKIALVTGGTSEIGTAICKQLAESGAQVVTNYNDQGEAKSWQAKLKRQGVTVKTIAADLTDFDSCDKLIEKVEKSMGSIDIVINSAELNDECLFSKMSKNNWNKVISNNLDSVYNVCRHAAEKMSERGFGRIVNISSIKARKGISGQTHYAASKAGMHGFTMALAQEVGRKGVTVNTISPGLLVDEANPGANEANIPEIPASRLGQVEEVAYLVDFLCSEQAAYINGTDIAINGGYYMQ